MIQALKATMQDCNLNFLLGSGLSSPFLPTLGNYESLLTALDAQTNLSSTRSQLIRASIYKTYFDAVIKRNSLIIDSHASAASVLASYETFLKTLNAILLRRKSTILSKEVNLFTTNIDVFLEKALEDADLEFNDGFNGRFSPKFSLSHFKKTHFKKSLHYDNIAELPVFNLMKLHGSLSWQLNQQSIAFAQGLKQVKTLAGMSLPASSILQVTDNTDIDALVQQSASKQLDRQTEDFLSAYEQMLFIVNPSKEKFKHTLLNQNYYELLRLYSNELEKENTILIVMGFSFADEHIREITLRAANSNPTLMIYIFAHTKAAGDEIQARFPEPDPKNRNIKIIRPPQAKQQGGGGHHDKYEYKFKNLNIYVFKPLLDSITAGASGS